jgi:hypothetical protein
MDREKNKGATPAELVEAHSSAMAVIEGIWREVAKRANAEAKGDGMSAAAIACNRANFMLRKAQAFHLEADLLAMEMGHVLPGGEGVPMPAFGGR